MGISCVHITAEAVLPDALYKEGQLGITNSIRASQMLLTRPSRLSCILMI